MTESLAEQTPQLKVHRRLHWRRNEWQREVVWELNRLSVVRTGPVAWRRVKNRLSHWQAQEKMDPCNIWIWKRERLNFIRSYNQRDLKPWNFKNQWLSFGRAQSMLGIWVPIPKERADKQPMQIQHRSNSLENVWGIYGRESYVLTLEYGMTGKVLQE